MGVLARHISICGALLPVFYEVARMVANGC